LGLSRLIERLHVAWLILAMLLLAAPMAHKVLNFYPSECQGRPDFLAAASVVQLPSGHGLEKLVEAVRKNTPALAIYVAERADVHLTTLLQRTAWTPPVQERGHAGMGITSNQLLVNTFKISRDRVQARQEKLRWLYGNDDGKAAKALEDMLSLKRPLIVILENPRHEHCVGRVANQPDAQVIFDSTDYTVWMIR